MNRHRDNSLPAKSAEQEATRGQTELPALGIAFLFLTVALLITVAAADTAFSAADRDAIERQTAVSLSDELVNERASVTARENVLNESALAQLSGTELVEAYGLDDHQGATVQLDGETIAEHGEVTDGTTVERIVSRESQELETLEPLLADSLSVSLPRRTDNVTLTLSPPTGTTVRSVRANNQTVLKNEAGLEGTFDLSLSTLSTTTLWFEAAGPMPRGSVEIEYLATETQKSTLTVTVDE